MAPAARLLGRGERRGQLLANSSSRRPAQRRGLVVVVRRARRPGTARPGPAGPGLRIQAYAVSARRGRGARPAVPEPVFRHPARSLPAGPASRARSGRRPGSPGRRVAVPAEDRRGHQQAGDDGLLGGLDDRSEVVVEVAVRRLVHQVWAAPRSVPQAGREGQEDLAARVVAGAAGAGEARGRPGGPAAGSRPRRPARRSPRRRCRSRPARGAGGPASAAAGRSAHRRRSAARGRRSWSARERRPCPVRDDPRRRTDAALEPEAAHPGARRRPHLRGGRPTPADAAPRAQRVPRTSSRLTCIRRASLRKLSSHSATTGMITSRRRSPASSSIEQLARGVVDPADLHGRGQEDRRLGQPPLLRRQEAGALAGAVEHRAAGRDRRAEAGCRPGRPPSRRCGRRRGRPAAPARRARPSRARRRPRARRAIEPVGPGGQQTDPDSQVSNTWHPGSRSPRLQSEGRRAGVSHARLPVVWAEDALRHEPGAEIWVGVSTPGTEVPGARATVLRDAVGRRRARRIVAAGGTTTRRCAAVHDPALLDHLATVAGVGGRGLPGVPAQDRVVPYVFPTAGDARRAAGCRSRPRPTPAPGCYCYDTMTLVGPGTWEAARAAVDAALTAADLVAARGRLAYALCRPPGTTRPGARSAARATSTTPRRGRGAAAGRRRPGRGRRHRRPPRQRHAGDLLRPRRRVLRLAARRPGRGLVPALRRLRRRARRGAAEARTSTCRSRRAPATTAGWPRSTSCAPGRGRGAGGGGRLARPGRGRGRPGEPAGGDRRGYRPAGRAARRARLPTVARARGRLPPAHAGRLRSPLWKARPSPR